MWKTEEKHPLPYYVNLKKNAMIEKFKENFRRKTKSEISKYVTGVKLDRKDEYNSTIINANKPSVLNQVDYKHMREGSASVDVNGANKKDQYDRDKVLK